MALYTALFVVAVWTLSETVSGQALVVNNATISRNGRWSRWSTWSSCTDCGRGMIGRYRSCNAPAPAGNGLSCYGLNEQRKQCFAKTCPDRNGGWASWEAWGLCYANSCGGRGLSYRVRTCTNPRRSGRGRRCRGRSVLSKSCRRVCEQKPGLWQVWGPWNECAADSCESGKRLRRRQCTISNEGGACVGSDYESVTCTRECVKGVWQTWEPWNDCITTGCNTSGKRMRRRHCTLSNGGVSCDGDDEETESCTRDCEKGVWQTWEPWLDCAASYCTDGTRLRRRHCAYSAGGVECDGSDDETETCKRVCDIAATTVNGAWSAWGEWGSCSVTCGSGRRYRQRKCDNPAPNGKSGRFCIGGSETYQTCTLPKCTGAITVHGAWSAWGAWGSCSVTCGSGGRQYRQRKCDSPAPSGKAGLACRSYAEDYTSCKMPACPGALIVHGLWSKWGEWGACSVTCGSGRRYRQRKCDNPAPSGKNGQFCRGVTEEYGMCTLPSCINVDGGWSTWTDWSMCYADCDRKGHRYKQRQCSNPYKLAAGRTCSGYHILKELCYRDCLNENVEWSLWGSWGTCDARVCDVEGTRRRYRACADLTGNADGKNCPGNNSEIVTCTRPCPTADDPSETTTISSTASTLITTTPFIATTEFITPGDFKTVFFTDSFTTVGVEPTEEPLDPTEPGDEMTTFEPTTIEITEKPVTIYEEEPVDGEWGNWSSFAPCSVTCGQGSSARQRSCNSPSPSNGGKVCLGPAVEMRKCMVAECPKLGYGKGYVQRCPNGFFTCAKGSITCIQKEFVCDCTSDCDDGSDESKDYAECTAKCRSVAAGTTPTLLLVIVSVCLHFRNIIVGPMIN